MGSATRRTVTVESLYNGRLLGASQDGSREFISILASICTNSSYLPPTLIYRRDSHNLCSSWVEDVNSSDLV